MSSLTASALILVNVHYVQYFNQWKFTMGGAYQVQWLNRKKTSDNMFWWHNNTLLLPDQNLLKLVWNHVFTTVLPQFYNALGKHPPPVFFYGFFYILEMQTLIIGKIYKHKKLWGYEYILHVCFGRGTNVSPCIFYRVFPTASRQNSRSNFTLERC